MVENIKERQKDLLNNCSNINTENRSKNYGYTIKSND